MEKILESDLMMMNLLCSPIEVFLIILSFCTGVITKMCVRSSSTVTFMRNSGNLVLFNASDYRIIVETSFSGE